MVDGDLEDKRSHDAVSTASLRAQLNEDQRYALMELERFGWELKFIRHPMFQDPVPVVFDGERSSFGVLRVDGSLDDAPGFDIRDQL